VKTNKELLKGSAVTLILTVLNRADSYGYELAKEIERSSKGAFTLTEGTLYPLLHELERDHHVESYWVEKKDERKRKYYRITKSGKKTLKERTKDWESFRTALDEMLTATKHEIGWAG